MSSNNPVRKRDRIRDFLRSSAKEPSSASAGLRKREIPSDPAALPAPAPSLRLSPASLSQPFDVLKEIHTTAISSLSEQERSLIEEYVASNVDDAIQAAYDAAIKQKKLCEDERWSASVKVDKVLLWLERLKPVAGTTTNADPIHIGLPWAGICLTLENTVSDSCQMTRLMMSIDLALCNMNRSRAYLDYFRRLPASLTSGNLQNALVVSHTHLLHFLAEVLRTALTNTSACESQTLWRNLELSAFGAECDKLEARLNIAVNDCNRELHAQESTQAVQWRIDLEATLQALNRIQSVQRRPSGLQATVDLSNLPRVPEATYNSYSEAKLSQCLDGTRSEILHDITQWAEKPDSKVMFWLCGKAGTGKSTISRTIAQSFDKQGYLGASFFFKRGEKNRSNADLFFSCIAAQLADLIPQMRIFIAVALDRDSFLCGRGLQEQFEKLLLQPLLSVEPEQLPQHSLAIVIDALDECDTDTDIQMFLKLLAQLKAESPLQLRVFMTSRPELPIQLGFRKLDGSLHQDILLEEVQEQTIERDIRTYFENEFAKMRQDRQLLWPDDALPVDWPRNDDMEKLVDMAVPLFIFASTVCRFISDSNPQGRLELILKQRHNVGSAHSAKLYLPILNQLLLEKNEEERKETLLGFCEVVGPIVVAADPLSVSSLASLLLIGQENIKETLKHLHSVLYIPSSRSDPVRLLHQSFRDFLIDQKRKDSDFWIDEMETHRGFAYHCLQLLQEPEVLKRDICCVEQPGFRRVDLAPDRISFHVPADVAYACIYWPWHLIKSKERLRDNSQAHCFLRAHLLHWLEALSWLGRISMSTIHLDDLMSISKGEDCREAAALLADAKKFILSNRLAIEFAPLQIYQSALIFAPMESVIRSMFQAEFANVWDLFPSVSPQWSAEILKLEGCDVNVDTVAFSPDDRAAASLYSDGILSVWNVQSGREEHKLKTFVEHDEAKITFSEDCQVLSLTVARNSGEIRKQSWNAQTGEQVRDPGNKPFADRNVVVANSEYVVAIASESWLIELFDMRTSTRLHSLEGHLSMITALVFLSDNQSIISGSEDGMLQLWSVASGTRMHKFRGNGSCITTIAVAPIGHVAASTSADGTRWLWNAQTGKQLHRLEGWHGHAGHFTAMAFSHDGEVVIFASEDGTVQMWDVQTGVQTLIAESSEREHGHRAPLVAVSPIARVGLVTQHDQTLQLWDTRTGASIQRLKGRHGIDAALSFSPDGLFIVSMSSDGIVQLWNTQTYEQLPSSSGQSFEVKATAFSSDLQTIATASNDAIVRLWTTRSGKTLGQCSFDIHEFDTAILTLKFALGDEVVIITTSSGRTRFWNLKTGQTTELGNLVRERNSGIVLPDDRTVALWTQSGTLRQFNIEERDLLQKHETHCNGIEAVTISPDGQMVAAGSCNNIPWLWNTQMGKQTLGTCLHSTRKYGIRMVVSPDGQILVTECVGKVQLWNTYTGEATRTLAGCFVPGSTKFVFSQDCGILAASFDRDIQLWDTHTGEQMGSLRGYQNSIRAMAFSPNSRIIASASFDKTVRLWDIHRAEKTQATREHEDTVSAVVFCPVGKTVASTSSDETVRLWDTQTGKEIQRPIKSGSEARKLAFSPDGKLLATMSLRIIRIWNIQTGEQTQAFTSRGDRQECNGEESHNSESSEEDYYLQTEHDVVRAMAFSLDGQLVASTTPIAVHVWNVQTGQRMQKLKGHKDYQSVFFSPDGQLIASISNFKILHLWKTLTGEKVHILNVSWVSPWPGDRKLWTEGQTGIFSPDCRAVAVALGHADPCLVKVWDVQTGELMQTLSLPINDEVSKPVHNKPSGHRSRSVAFSGDGESLQTWSGTYLVKWTEFGTLEYPFKRTQGIELAGQWVRHQGQDLLYLPFDHQGFCSAVHGETLVIGQDSGAVDFFRLKKISE